MTKEIKDKERGKLLQLTTASPVEKWMKVLAKRADEELSFTPTRQMDRAKAKLWDGINNNPLLAVGVEDMTLDAIVDLCGTGRVLDWIDESPAFLSWLCDEHYERIDMEAVAAKARRVIEEIMDSPMEEKMLTAKDKLNAANLLLQLADKFPNKRRELVYLDKELGRMGAEDVDRESKRIDKLLSAGKSDVDNET